MTDKEKSYMIKIISNTKFSELPIEKLKAILQIIVK